MKVVLLLIEISAVVRNLRPQSNYRVLLIWALRWRLSRAKRRQEHPRGMDEIQPYRQNPLVTGRTYHRQSGETAPPSQSDLTRHSS